MKNLLFTIGAMSFWTLTFLLECMTTLLTCGLYLLLIDKTCTEQVGEWYMTSKLRREFKDNPEIMAILDKYPKYWIQ